MCGDSKLTLAEVLKRVCFFFFFFKKTKQKTIKTGKPLWLLHHDTINKGVFFKGERKKKGREMMKDGYLCMMAFL